MTVLLPAPPVPAVVVEGMPITGSLWNAQVGAQYTWFTAGPFGALRQTTAQTFSTGVWTPITWQTIDADTFGGWSSANPSRYTAAVPGWYRVAAQVDFAGSSSSGFRSLAIQVNGVNDAAHRFAKQQLQTTGTPLLDDPRTCSIILHLNAGDYVEAIVYTSITPAALASADGYPRMTVRWVGQ
jgi:hypothetical protein